MPNSPFNILVVDDSESDARSIVLELKRVGLSPVTTRVETETAFRNQLQARPDIIVSDFDLQQFDALTALQILRESGQNIPFLIVSDNDGKEKVVRALKNGARDYLPKNRLNQLGGAVRQALEQRRQLQDDLKAQKIDADANSRLKLVLAAAKMGVMEWDVDSQEIHWSPECLEILGVRTTRATFDDFFALLHPEDRDRVLSEMAKVVTTRTQFAIEFRVALANGQVRWILQHGRFDDGIRRRPARIVSTVQDINDRKIAEIGLRSSERRFRESEERYRLALDAAHQGTWRYDFATDRIWLDETCRIHHGLSLTEMVEMKPPEVLSMMNPDDLQRLIETASRVESSVSEEGGFSCEYRISRPDGSHAWISLAARFQFAHHRGRRIPVQIHGTTRDITEQKRAELDAHLQSTVLEQIAIGAPLRTTLEKVVDLVENHFPGSICSIHLVDRTHKFLSFVAGNRLPIGFQQHCHMIPIGPRNGSCGTAAHFGKSIIVADIATDPLWEGVRAYPLAYGLKSCWSIPILADPHAPSSEERVLGTFSVYRREPSTPGPDAEGIMATAVHLARLALDREKAHRDIRESEARNTMISEMTKSVTFAVRMRPDGTSTVQWVRPRFGFLSGYSQEECEIFGWEMQFHPSERKRVRQLCMEMLAGIEHEEELLYQTKDGRTLTVLLHGKLAELGPAPGEGLIVGGFRDITELKSVESALRASEERFRLALQGANEGLWDWDLESNEVFLSPRWLSMLGFQEHELQHDFQTWFKLIHPDDRQVAIDRLSQFLTSRNEIYESEFRLRHKSGKYLNILSRGFASRDASGKTIRLVGTHQDITERKLADEELLSSRRRLEKLSRQLINTREAELHHLARELHDEIGQALTFMKMSLRNIQQNSDDTTRKRLDESILMVDDTLDRVRNLSLNMRPPHLDDLGLVATLHWYLKNQAKVAGFQEYISVVPPEMHVSTDLATVCFRITQEAVTNAIRHAKPTRIDIELRMKNDELHLKIHDDGCGFDVEEARNNANRGSSLGLISMQERANLAGGQIEIVSAQKKGTTIHAWFPPKVLS